MPPVEYLTDGLLHLLIAICAAAAMGVLVTAMMYAFLCIGVLAAAVGWGIGGVVTWTFRALARLFPETSQR